MNCGWVMGGALFSPGRTLGTQRRGLKPDVQLAAASSLTVLAETGCRAGGVFSNLKPLYLNIWGPHY